MCKRFHTNVSAQWPLACTQQKVALKAVLMMQLYGNLREGGSTLAFGQRVLGVM